MLHHRTDIMNSRGVFLTLFRLRQNISYHCPETFRPIELYSERLSSKEIYDSVNPEPFHRIEIKRPFRGQLVQK